MTAALLAAVTGVVGLAIGRLWDTRSESTRWRRDQKTACYQRLAEEFQATYEAIRIIALTDTNSTSLQSLIEHTRTGGFAAWDSAVAAIWLHGSAEVVASATQLDDAIGTLFYSAVERQLTTLEAWRQARVPAREALERFIESARKELDLPSVPVRLFTDPRAIPSGSN
ncbi:hypothetical protein AB0I30_12885 [Nocardia tengchongensis]|uniref:hypothetical protein n=1 Tax=Nocardia tengchongensis TaxID=2055889 RepID=UPI0033DB2711